MASAMSGAAQPNWRQLSGYRLEWLRPDLLAGMAVAAYLIPQCLAYGELAGLDPVRGLWAILPPILLYALLGSSPQLSVGPESTTAVMTAAAIAPLAAGDAQLYASLSSGLALAVGAICCLGAWARLGFVANLLSKPILIGYMAGVAAIMIGSQLHTIWGIELHTNSLPAQLWELVQRQAEWHWPSLWMTLAVLSLLAAMQKFFPRAPGPLLAMLLATGAVAAMHLDQLGLAVIGEIPGDLPGLVLPDLPASQLIKPLLSSALGIALVGYSDNILTARAFAARGGYRVDANQELLVLGTVNLANGIAQGFPVSSSGSRTALGDALGSRSQLFSLIALALVLLVLLLLRPLLALFPKVALAAVVIMAALRLIDIDGFIGLLRFRFSEFRLALITCIGVLLSDILIGVALAVALSILDLLWRIVRPNDAVLGEVPSMAGYHNVISQANVITRPGLLIYRYDAPLCFANADHFYQRVMEVIDAESEPVRWLLINAEAIIDVDSTALDMLLELEQDLRHLKIEFCLARVKSELRGSLERGGLVERIGADHLFATIGTAIEAFHRMEALEQAS
jgi:high affinity sulfate transporter 1